ncbi:MAG: hypothetical protein AUG51_14780 [Acidobacteria bacterium 13_1_20CM_3_53_8]|nr:MAG: hypothetical protein AUG51_14780 [Acidobacteria bacterium 13_1_20CM_3_53_8]
MPTSHWLPVEIEKALQISSYSNMMIHSKGMSKGGALPLLIASNNSKRRARSLTRVLNYALA